MPEGNASEGAQQDTTAASSGDAGGDGQKPETLSITQQQLDQMVSERLNRQRAQFKDYDELKAKAGELDALKESQRSESEKLVAALEKAQKTAKDAEERERAANELVRDSRVRAAVVSEASRNGAVDPDAVFLLLDKSQISFGDGDQMNGIEDAVRSVLADRPYLAGARSQGGFDAGDRGAPAPVSSAADFNAKLRREAGFA